AFRRFIPLFLACNARLESFRCSVFNFFSIFFVNLLLSILRPSERMAKLVMPKSIPIDVSVLSNGCTSVSTRMDMKYLPLGFLLRSEERRVGKECGSLWERLA